MGEAGNQQIHIKTRHRKIRRFDRVRVSRSEIYHLQMVKSNHRKIII